MTIPFTRWPEEFARRYREKGYWQDLPLTHILTDRADSDAVAIIDGERHITYRAFNQAVNNLASALQARGLQRGETALVQLGNVAEFYITFFALLQIGVAPVNALFSHQRSELNAYAEQIKPAALIAELEPFDRELFGGIVGWCDSEGNGEWVVTIRCARLRENTVRLFAGAGIVPASSPVGEWRETGVKLSTMLNVFGLH